MGIEINLLPKEMAKSKNVEKSVKLLNKLAIGSTAIFLIIAVAGGAFFFLISGRLNQGREEKDTLVANIQSLQATEASIILLQDRIEKAQTVLGQRNSEDIFDKQRSVLAVAPENASFSESSVDNSLSSLELDIASSSSLVTLLSNLVAQGNYVSLILEELSFSPFTGYKAQFSVY
jgi:hypothetical protein